MLSRPDTFERDVVAAQPVLRRFAVALCRNPDRADDLVQDTVLAALTHKSQFQPGTNLRAWLMVILRNKFRSGIRRRSREVEDPDEALAKAIPFEDSPLRKMEARELLALVDRMPEMWRAPLRLLADGASYEEIAAELNEHEGTIKSRINRAREVLKTGAE